MGIFYVLIAIGYIIGIIGWCLAAFLDAREFGSGLFFVGFFSVAFGMIGAQLCMKFEGKFRAPGIGLKIGAVGFGISCLSFFAEIFFMNEKITNYIFYGGVLVGMIGILIILFNLDKAKDIDPWQ